jgi:hypothetical protein
VSSQLIRNYAHRVYENEIPAKESRHHLTPALAASDTHPFCLDVTEFTRQQASKVADRARVDSVS